MLGASVTGGATAPIIGSFSTVSNISSSSEHNVPITIDADNEGEDITLTLSTTNISSLQTSGVSSGSLTAKVAYSTLT